MTKSESIKELSAALTEFQKEVGNVPKDATNPFFKSKYASLENVISTIRPLLAKHHLSFSQFPDEDGLTTTLMHSSGEFLQATAKLVIKDHTPQGHGSSITYLRRYALSAVLGIATEEDDDGNAASAAKPTAAKPATPAPAKKVAAPAVVVSEQKKAKIKELCDAKAPAPLLTKEDYHEYIKGNTGLVMEPTNFDEIITRLTTIQ
jgi:hypothetical protein